MPQEDIKPADSDDETSPLIVGWDEGDTSFLILYSTEKGKSGYTTVRLNEKDIHELKRFLQNHYMPD